MNKLAIENEIWEQGYEHIACCDEVGRGCLFGSVLAAAVILPRGLEIEGIKDSKKLSHKKREALYEVIKEKAIAIGVGTASPEVIDKINIKRATRLAMKKAIMGLKDKDGNSILPDYILIDAEEVDVDIPQRAIVKGDDVTQGIGASSIVAKVIRDRMCVKWGEDYPQYEIAKNKGYGTKVHREALIEYGPTDMHRRSFIKKII